MSFSIPFLSKPQPSFNKNFDLLIRHLHEMKAAGYETYICSENPKHFERLAAIFKTSTKSGRASPKTRRSTCGCCANSRPAKAKKSDRTDSSRSVA